MAEIKFYANIEGSETLIRHDLGSGIGFYGATYGVSVPIGQTQDSTFITNSNGTATDHYAINNTKRTSTTEVKPNSIAALNMQHLPNMLCPLRINFNHTEAVAVQNCSLKIFNRHNILKNASGVSTYVYEARHPHQTPDSTDRQLDQRGDSTTQWIEFYGIEGAPEAMAFTSSPGVSGFNSNSNDVGSEATHWQNLTDVSTEGITHRSTQHDWYCALSAEPEDIGSKTFYGLYFTLEYL